ncbi:MAG: helix-turn-helix transcriptional regulator [Acidobacteriota bacterium]|nr:helix-turn-helix transcriptional regulator [Acidobacteriota bacterium]
MTHLALSDRTLELVARRFRYLGEPFRLRILQSLSRGEKTVGQLVEDLDANQPNVSKHLQMLLEAGLVSRRKEGTSRVYSMGDPMLLTLCDLVCRSARERTEEDLAELQSAQARKP